MDFDAAVEEGEDVAVGAGDGYDERVGGVGGDGVGAGGGGESDGGGEGEDGEEG